MKFSAVINGVHVAGAHDEIAKAFAVFPFIRVAFNDRRKRV